MTEHRKSQRVSLQRRIELIHCGRSYTGYLENLSTNGALVRLDDSTAFPVGEPLILCVETEQPGNAVPSLQLSAESIHYSFCQLGMKFVGCDEQILPRLLLLVERMAADPEELQAELERIRDYITGYQGSL